MPGRLIRKLLMLLSGLFRNFKTRSNSESLRMPPLRSVRQDPLRELSLLAEHQEFPALLDFLCLERDRLVLELFRRLPECPRDELAAEGRVIERLWLRFSEERADAVRRREKGETL